MNTLKGLIKILAGLVAGAIGGLVISTLVIVLFTDITFGKFISDLANLDISKGISAGLIGIGSLFASLLSLIAIHEAGHLVCGMLTGYRFVSFRLFNLTFIRLNGKLCIKRFAVSGTGGQCLLAPPDLPIEKIPIVWYNLGGIIANVIALLPVLPLLWIHVHPFIPEFAVIFTIVDLFLIITNGIPMQMGGIGNDAYNIWRLLKDKKSKPGMVFQLRCNALIQEGVRPKDIPDEWFEADKDTDYRNPLEVSIPLMAATRLIDLMKWEDAHNNFENLYSHKSELMPLYTTEIACELVFTSLVTGRTNRAKELYDTRLERYIETYRKVMSSKERISFAISLYLDNDINKARTIYNTLLKRRNGYLLQGEVKSDLAIMESLLRKAENDTTETMLFGEIEHR